MVQNLIGVNSIWNDSLNKKGEFTNEDEYHKFIELNIKKFCEDVLNLGEYVSHESKFYIEKNRRFGGNTQRPDLYIVGKNETAIVEIKYPTNCFAEIRNALSQLLCYSVLAEENNLKYDRLCLVSPSYQSKLFSTFKKYAKNIELYYLTKEYNSKIILS